MTSGYAAEAPLPLPFSCGAPQRRDEARALADWERLRAGRIMPGVEACDGGTDRDGATVWHVITPDALTGPDGGSPQDVDSALLAAAILARWSKIEAARGPCRMSMRAGDVVWRGILLPFGLADGRLGAVRAVVDRAETPRVADLADVRAIVSSVGHMPPRLPPTSPWAAGTGALGLLDRPRAQPLEVAERLAVARTWAALAAGYSYPGRQGGLQAALAGAFDILLALRADPRALPLSGAAEISAAHAVDLVFDAHASATDRGEMALALAHGERLGLGRGGFIALLERFPGGCRGLAAAERAANGEIAPEQDAAVGDFVLEPLDVRWLMRLARRETGTPSMPGRLAA